MLLQPPELGNGASLTFGSGHHGLQSMSGLYTFELHADGELALYSGGVSLWSTKTGGKCSGPTLIMQARVVGVVDSSTRV